MMIKLFGNNSKGQAPLTFYWEHIMNVLRTEVVELPYFSTNVLNFLLVMTLKQFLLPNYLNTVTLGLRALKLMNSKCTHNSSIYMLGK